MEEFFADAKDDLTSGNSTATTNREITHATPEAGKSKEWRLKGPFQEAENNGLGGKKISPKIAS